MNRKDNVGDMNINNMVFNNFAGSGVSEEYRGNGFTSDTLYDFTGDNFEWEEVATKRVKDFDGFYDDYTMYKRADKDEWICIFGDKEIYEPDSAYADYETENEQEAWEWFDDYNGAEDLDDYEEDEENIITENSNRYRRVKKALFGDPTGKIKTFAIVAVENPLGWAESTEEEFKDKYAKWKGEGNLELADSRRRKYNKEQIADVKAKELLHRIEDNGNSHLKYGGFNYVQIKGRYDGNDEKSFIVFNIPLEDAKAIARSYGQESFWYGKVSNKEGEPSTLCFYKTDNACITYKGKETSNSINTMEDADDMFSKYGFYFSIDLNYFGANVKEPCDVQEFEKSLNEDSTFQSRAMHRREAYKEEKQKNRLGGKKVMRESKKRSYGGAYDIEDDMYFTKEDLYDFAEEVVESLNTKSHSGDVDYSDIYIENDTLVMSVVWDSYEYTVMKRIDMRKIRKASDLKKYVKIFADKFFNEMSEDGFNIEGQDNSLNESIEEETINDVDCGKASLINDLVKESYSLVDSFNQTIVALKQIGIGEDILTILDNNVATINNCVGQLQTCLASVDTNAEQVKEGTLEAEEQITSDDDKEVDEFLDNYVNWLDKKEETSEKAVDDVEEDEFLTGFEQTL